MADEYEESYDADGTAPAEGAESVDTGPAAAPEQSEGDRALVQKKLKIIKADKKHWKPDFDRMRRDMFMVYHGRDKDWSEKKYKAYFISRHINQKTASIYAKNPKVVARRKEMLDFAVWDEDPKSLLTAMQVVQQAQMAAQARQLALAEVAMGAGGLDAPAMGHNGGPPLEMPPDPMQDPAVLNAQAIIQDVQVGMQRRQLIEKFGKTLELLYTNAMRRQTPLDFKSGMKQVVRRASTTAAGYCELGLQRQWGVPKAINNELNDARTRLEYIEKMLREAGDASKPEDLAEQAQLQKTIADLEAKPQICLRAGLTFAWHQSTRIIPDRLCKSFAGFIGARHITIEELLPKSEVEAKYKVDLADGYTPYNVKGEKTGYDHGDDAEDEDYGGAFAPDRKADDLVCVYRMYDKVSGLLYVMCEGHSRFLQEPASPDIKVPRFWPIYGLTFNQTESENEVFNPSDATLLRDMQNELNRSREGKREHRAAARPRFVAANGTFDPDKDLPALETGRPFEIILLTGDPNVDIEKRVKPFPMPGVDPNLYDTNEVMQDAMLTVGAQPAQLGGTSKSTATEAAIADGASSTSDGSAIDDLDAFLTDLARDGAIILQANLTKEDVIREVGPGAVWIEDLGMSYEDIQEEVYLEVEAGSSGKPNQAQEVRNFKELAPLMLQIPGIPPEKLAKEAVRRLDDRLDLNEWFVEGLPAMVAANRAQPMMGGDDPAKQDPNQQGGEGGDKSRARGQASGTGPAFGSNQV